MSTSCCLVLGGARSGKSAYAEARARALSDTPLYIATLRAQGETEMQRRISEHRKRRDPRWHTLEEPVDIVPHLNASKERYGCILVDCLTLWLTNLMLEGYDLEGQLDALIKAISGALVPLVFVSNEVGLGLVPETSLGRRFRDWQGRLNQEVARVCDEVVFIAAGLPLHLKPAFVPPEIKE